MPYDSSRVRRNKDICRELMFKDVPYSHVAAFFPSDKCLDLTLAKAKGIINKDTLLYMWENDCEKAAHILRWFHKNKWPISVDMGFNLHDDRGEPGDDGENILFTGKAESHNIHYLNAIETDLAFFDFCGEITDKVARFLRQFDFGDGAIIGFTFSRAIRNNRVYKALGNPYDDEGSEASKVWFDTCNELPTTAKVETSRCVDTIVLLRAILNKYNLNILECIEYHDANPTTGKGCPMVFLKFKVEHRERASSIYRRIFDSCFDISGYVGINGRIPLTAGNARNRDILFPQRHNKAEEFLLAYANMRHHQGKSFSGSRAAIRMWNTRTNAPIVESKSNNYDN